MTEAPATRSYHSPLRERRAAETRALVLRGFADLVTETGTTEFSVQDVADRAGVSLRTVYRYFPSRQALLDGLTDLLDEHMDDLREDSEVGWHYLPDRGLEGLMATIPAVYERFDELEPLSSAMAMLAAGGRGRARRHDERTDEFRRALEDELADVPDEVADEVFAVVRHLVSSLTWFVLRDEFGLPGADAGRAVARAIEAIVRDAADNA